MRFPFQPLPGADLPARPVVPVWIAGLPEAAQLCLLDTGSLRTRLPSWIAEVAGVALENAPIERAAIGGFITSGKATRVGITVGSHHFDAPVLFCDPWPLAFGLLGQEDFMRHFLVTISAEHQWLEFQPGG